MISDPFFYAMAVPAVSLAGLSKGGFGGGVSMIGYLLLTLAVPPLQAAAIMLPILIVMDVVGLVAWRGVYDKRSLVILIPAALCGIGAGWAAAASVSNDMIRLIVGVMALAFVADYGLKGKRRDIARAHNPPKGLLWGAMSGFTSFLSNVGAPPYQMYMLPLRLDPKLLAGTSIIFFAVVNAVKVGPYLLLGQFSPANLATSALLLPLAPLATLAGVKLIKAIDPSVFYRFTYALMFAAGIKQAWDGSAGLIG
ncbi:MAG TPA: sulfite exporter TauE/SafE family protein [Afifellaceae bacterium]|nr:sulfite exporter TauE/SafE family protein [Afifellaceae bacterium]